MNHTVEVFSDTKCELGEGPTYDPASDTLYWFDIVGKALLQKPASGGDTVSHALPMMASALAVIDDGRQLLATEKGLYVRDVASGRLSLHTELETDNPATRSNDARVHPCGAFWIGTMGKDSERKAGSIYWFFRGELRRLYPDITISNSICFSPDGATAYFTDTQKGIMFRVACDADTGLPQGEPDVFVDLRGGPGSIDGSVVDADGVLWNARWGAGCVDAYSPSGERLRTIQVPARQPSCPAFLGPDLDRVAVTSALQGLSEDERRHDPQGGMTFLLGVTVRGRPEPRVRLD